MKLQDILKFIDRWAPQAVSWEKDNIGLQVGQLSSEVTGVILALEVTEEVLQTAVKLRANTVLTHHPLIFYPIKKLDIDRDKTSRLIATALKNDISIISAHTNFDFTFGGVCHSLASKIGLENLKFLKPYENTLSKISVFVPKDSLNKVSEALFNAGAGIVGEYSSCSFSNDGTGTFLGSSNSNPTIGIKEELTKVDEVCLQVRVENWKLKGAVSAMIAAHPYETPAFEVFALKNQNEMFGNGVIGTLPTPMNVEEFLSSVSNNLQIPTLRYSKTEKKEIKKVAVVGGSGAEYLKDAISAGADAFITADVRYHSFQDAENVILLIDAGHFETEIWSLEVLEEKLTSFFSENDVNIPVNKFLNTNPINYFKVKE